MDIQTYIDQKKELHNILIKFLDQPDDNDKQDLFDLIESQKVLENRGELKELLYLLSKITKNHHRNKNFFIKIEQILLFCIDRIKQTFSNDEIFNIFKTSKNILLILFKNDIITVNDYIIQYLKRKNYNGYFYTEIQKYDKNWVSDLDSETLTNFEEKRQTGENDSYICQLIRDDSVEDFVAYSTRINLSLSKTTIKPSIFETNSFLMKNKEISLIEYAAFFGAIQIFQYLNLNTVELKKQLWLYSIHSNNADLIHLIEETDISPPSNSFEEAIKCHHNEIANYIQNFIFEVKLLHLAAEKDHYEVINLLLTQPNIKIAPNCFQGCNKLSQITIPSSVTEIGNGSFSGCSLLKQISISSSLASIGPYAFCGCSSLKQISIPSLVTEIGSSTFYECFQLESISIPSSVTNIGDSCFYDCTSLGEISLPSSLQSIEKNCFTGCSKLTSLVIPSSVKKICECAFNRCTSIITISIPSSVTEIAPHAFDGCSSIEHLEIPSSVTSIGKFAFYKCSNLEQIIIHSNIPSIGDCTFFRCSKLKQISIPSSVKMIGNSAFSDCSSLQEISLPSSVTKIGVFAFSGCKSLKQASIPSPLEQIGGHIFKGCSSLTKLTISSSIDPNSLDINSNVVVTKI